MPEIMTRDFGPIRYSEAEVFHFAGGMPGFGDCLSFLTVRPDPAGPLVVLQSLERPEVAFLTVPVEALAIDYQLRMVEADVRALGATSTAGLHALVIITLPAHGPGTVNLLGPIVLHQGTRRGVQAIREDNRYRAAEPAEALLSHAAGAADSPRAAQAEKECASCS